MQQQKTLPKQGFSLYTLFIFLPEEENRRHIHDFLDQ